MNSNACSRKGTLPLVFACSGGSDAGGLADQAARKLAKDGEGKMHCLSGIGGRVDGIVKTTEAAAQILAIDGCPLDCAKKTLEAAGINNFKHVRLADLGFEKGKSPATDENITKVEKHCAEAMSSLCGEACNA
jgi:uncharacterized metal-binding protein